MSRLKKNVATSACSKAAANVTEMSLPRFCNKPTHARNTIQQRENAALATKCNPALRCQLSRSSRQRRASQNAGKDRVAKTYQSASARAAANFHVTGLPILDCVK